MASPSPVPPVVAAAGPVDPVEALEDALEVARRDADAVVGDVELDHRPSLDATRDLDRAARVGVLHRVVEQVGERRHELAAVADAR